MFSTIRLVGLVVLVALAGCTEIQVGSHIFKKAYSGTCQTEGDLKVGKPYRVDGKTYTPVVSSLGYSERGIASWYGKDFHGKSSANGECYNMYAYTAAHKTLPLPSIVRVTNLENNKSVVVKVNDRGPFVRGRVIDLSYAAAQSLDVARMGTAPVLVEAIGGPHHFVGGARGNTMLAQGNLPKLGPDERGPTLASYSPSVTSEENLADDDVRKKRVIPEAITAEEAAIPNPDEMAPLPAAEVARINKQLPAPAQANELPPPPSSNQLAGTAPLVKTSVYVQTGAFADMNNAARQMDALRQMEPTAALSKVDVNGMAMTRVRSGPYASVVEADAALGKLVSAGFDGARLVVEPR